MTPPGQSDSYPPAPMPPRRDRVLEQLGGALALLSEEINDMQCTGQRDPVAAELDAERDLRRKISGLRSAWKREARS